MLGEYIKDLHEAIVAEDKKRIEAVLKDLQKVGVDRQSAWVMVHGHHSGIECGTVEDLLN